MDINQFAMAIAKMRQLQKKYVELRTKGKHDWNLLNDLKAQEAYVDLLINKIKVS